MCKELLLYRGGEKQQNGSDKFNRRTRLIDRCRLNPGHASSFGKNSLAVYPILVQQYAPKRLIGLLPPLGNRLCNLVEPQRTMVEKA